MLSYKEVKWLLENGVVFLQFKKANGDIRNMIATLKEGDGFVPSESYAKIKPENAKQKNEELFVVWEILEDGSGQWRAIRYDSLIQVGNDTDDADEYTEAEVEAETIGDEDA